MKLSYDLEDPKDIKAVLGLIVLQADETLETEFRSVLTDPSIRLYHSRIPSGADLNPETLMQMKADLPMAASLLPKTAEFDVIGYACTSGATFIGRDTVRKLIQTHHPDALVSDPITAVLAAFRKLNLKRLGFITPYVAEVSAAMRELLENEGLDIAAFGSFEQMEEALVARISDQSVLNALIDMGSRDDIEGLFVSCTNVNSFGIIEEAERLINKPVVTSNQALFWHMLTLSDVATKGAGPGKLFNS
ncbi:Asp/Glu racemase [Sneathiella limimaris]|uniref:maleate cis-trans isomerase family protein n=1 Tax=Sneathiella limimaris TaxID=1964213 RepID=UPI00146DB867|nr:Asp/Glu racemase [Sneathiella limimaris]